MKLPVASSRHLSAFAEDVDHELRETALFSKVSIKKTGLENSALSVVCVLSDPSTKPEEVMKALEQLWHEAPLRYGANDDVCKIAYVTNEVHMRFSTATENVRVTGHIEVLNFG